MTDRPLNPLELAATLHWDQDGRATSRDLESKRVLDHWLQPLTMMYHKHRTFIDAIPSEADRLDRLCEINIEMQVRRIAATPIVENAWARGQRFHVHGWIYAIHDGLLRDLGPHLSSIVERDTLPSIDRRVIDPVEPISAMRRQAMDVFSGSSNAVAALSSESSARRCNSRNMVRPHSSKLLVNAAMPRGCRPRLRRRAG